MSRRRTRKEKELEAAFSRAELELDRIREVVRRRAQRPKEVPPATKLTPVDQIFRLSRLPQYKAFVESDPTVEEFRAAFPQVSCSGPPPPQERLARAVDDFDASGEGKEWVEAFHTPAIRVVRAEVDPDLDEQGEPMSPVRGSAVPKDRGSKTVYVAHKGRAFTTWHPRDLLGGRYLTIQVDTMADRSVVRDMFRSLLRSLPKTSGRARAWGPTMREIIRVALRERTQSPKEISGFLHGGWTHDELIKRIDRALARARREGILP